MPVTHSNDGINATAAHKNNECIIWPLATTYGPSTPFPLRLPTDIRANEHEPEDKYKYQY